MTFCRRNWLTCFLWISKAGSIIIFLDTFLKYVGMTLTIPIEKWLQQIISLLDEKWNEFLRVDTFHLSIKKHSNTLNSAKGIKNTHWWIFIDKWYICLCFYMSIIVVAISMLLNELTTGLCVYSKATIINTTKTQNKGKLAT